MAWIESHDSLRDHPKARKLARWLSIPIPQALGHLHLLWWWAVTYAEDGVLNAFDAEEIAFAAMWEGDPEDFRRALVGVGWIDEDEQGARIHDWWEYAGKLIASRQAAREGGAFGNHERWHAARDVRDPNCPYCQSGGESGGDRGANRTLPNHTQPDRTEDPLSQRENQNQALSPDPPKNRVM